MPSKALPRGLPPSTRDLASSEGIEAERSDLERLRRDGKIDGATMAAGIAALDAMERIRRLAERHRR